jgi:hypothetical protein
MRHLTHLLDDIVDLSDHAESLNNHDTFDYPRECRFHLLLIPPTTQIQCGQDSFCGSILPDRCRCRFRWKRYLIHIFHDVQVTFQEFLLKDGISGEGLLLVEVEHVLCELSLRVVHREELGEDLVADLFADLSVLEVADQVIIGEVSGPVLLEEPPDQQEQPQPLVQDRIILYVNH